jgi:hypothetical protein
VCIIFFIDDKIGMPVLPAAAGKISFYKRRSINQSTVKQVMDNICFSE